MNEDYFIAVDFHCKYQKVAWMNRATGETGEADLEHADLEKLRQWYKAFRPGTVVGMEASGYGWWFEQLIQEVGLELWVGHPGHIARMRLRKQKNDRRDAEHLLGLLVRDEFPQVWRPSPEQREQKTLIRYRVKLMQERTRCVNTLRALVYNFNLQIKSGSLSKASREKIRALSMGPRLDRERDELLDRIEDLEERIKQRQKEIEGWADQDPGAARLMTIPGVGPLTSLYLVRTLGPVKRFAGMRQVVSYVGLDSVEHSSDNQNKRRRYGKISKQGDRMLRWLLVQSAVAATRRDERLKRFYRRLLLRKGIAVARVAAARKLLVWSWVLLRDEIDYPEFLRRASVRDLPARLHGLS